ncbi:unnamed protein product [Rhizophagus irregularis]|nr:unnamed protein product [Rhizophagus irregularis]
MLHFRFSGSLVGIFCLTFINDFGGSSALQQGILAFLSVLKGRLVCNFLLTWDFDGRSLKGDFKIWLVKFCNNFRFCPVLSFGYRIGFLRICWIGYQ